MIKAICILFFFIYFHNANAQQNVLSNGHKVTFKLKVSDISPTDTVAIIWLLLPYEEGKTVRQLSIFPKKLDTDGLYQQTITFPDSMMGKTIGYLYTVTGDKYDIFRNFVLEENQSQERIESWGYVDGLASKVKVSGMLFVEPSSDAETALFAKPYVGITTDGTPIKNLFPIKKTGYSTAVIKNAVTAFTATLTKEQKAVSVFPVASEEWRRWHNIENWKRAGICLENMNTKQKELVFDILKESLSERGFQKAKNIMTMEAYLATLVPNYKNLGGEKYWFTFFGTPSDIEPYGWQIEGHHLVINYFILGDQIVMTPTFMGSEPTRIDSGENKGLRTFETEEKKGLNFYLSLDSLQKKEARLWNKKDFDFNQSEAFRDIEIIATTGIVATKLAKTQQDALLDLIAEYVNNVRDGQAKVKMTDVKLHLNETHFTWVQGDNIESPFYYRIHSPVILIEFDHQTPVFIYDYSKVRPGPVKTHIHTVVRTPNGNDYGKDLLKEHLEKNHHHKKKPSNNNNKKNLSKKH